MNIEEHTKYRRKNTIALLLTALRTDNRNKIGIKANLEQADVILAEFEKEVVAAATLDSAYVSFILDDKKNQHETET